MNPNFPPLNFHLLSDKETGLTDIETCKFAAHEHIIKPMLSESTEAFVFKGTAIPHEGAFGHMTPGAMDLAQFGFLLVNKEKYRFDLNQDCINGSEHLWNARGYKRGSIVIILPKHFDFSHLLPFCFDYGYNCTPNIGHSPGAVRLCHEIRGRDRLAIIFSASNGVEYMEIYASDSKIREIEKQAEMLCGSNLARQIRLAGETEPD